MKLHTTTTEVCKVTVGQDDTSAEKWAMMAAMYSRSINGIEAIVDQVGESDGSAFMDKFYIGYGHESIGDLVDVRLFVEGVPFYVAFMLEHYSQFRGQESSTRYIDFSKQRPAFTANKELYEKQIAKYLSSLETVTSNLMAKLKPETAADVRAVNARAFDICRCLLPWGATTNVAWYGDLRSIMQQLARLSKESGVIGDLLQPYVRQIHATLRDVYPSSVPDLDKVRHTVLYFPLVYSTSPESYLLHGLLDFGSLRDLNRHRVGRHVSVLDIAESFHSWYIEMLNAHGVNTDGDTYSEPDHFTLGQRVSFMYSFDAPQTTYLARLRSAQSVHPTLRKLIQDQLTNSRYTNAEPDPGPFGAFMIRGTQTILMKGE